jgi:Mn2+/Fe2+ NRAMP family transporter
MAPRAVKVDSYHQLPMVLSSPWGRAGVLLFAGSLFITCLGATAEIALALGYKVAQGFGWNWGEDLPPSGDARFSLTYTITLLISTLLILIGIDPVKLTNFAMALTSATLPVAIVPFLVLMNDKKYLGEHTNGWPTNIAILLISLLAGVLAIISIPLEIVGGS